MAWRSSSCGAAPGSVARVASPNRPVVRIAPSILAADFADLAVEVARVEPVSDLLHVDVMDGHFVPNLSLGPPVVAALNRHTRLHLDCHLMLSEPGRYLEAFKEAGADGCTVHVEVGGTTELIDRMRALQLDVGLALNPDTPFEAVEPFIDQADLVLIMTVHPGFGGQSFISEVVPKVTQVKAACDRLGVAPAIQVDGGIDERTAAIVVAAGADVLVAGSAIFGADDPAAAAGRIRAAAESARAA